MICRTVAIAMLCFASLASTFAKEKETYVPGKILSVERHAVTAQCCNSTTDQPPQSHDATYVFVINSGNTNYTCTIDATSSSEAGWLVGKDIQIRVKGKTLYSKSASGHIERCHIVKKEPAK